MALSCRLKSHPSDFIYLSVIFVLLWPNKRCNVHISPPSRIKLAENECLKLCGDTLLSVMPARAANLLSICCKPATVSDSVPALSACRGVPLRDGNTGALAGTFALQVLQ